MSWAQFCWTCINILISCPFKSSCFSHWGPRWTKCMIAALQGVSQLCAFFTSFRMRSKLSPVWSYLRPNHHQRFWSCRAPWKKLNKSPPLLRLGDTICYLKVSQFSRSSISFISLVLAKGFRDLWPSAEARWTLLDASRMTWYCGGWDDPSDDPFPSIPWRLWGFIICGNDLVASSCIKVSKITQWSQCIPVPACRFFRFVSILDIFQRFPDVAPWPQRLLPNLPLAHGAATLLPAHWSKGGRSAFI